MTSIPSPEVSGFLSARSQKNRKITDWTWKNLYWAIAFLVLAMMIGSLVEAVMAEAVLRTFIGDDGVGLSYLAALCLVFVANLMAFSAGAALHSSRAWAAGIGFLWLGLGLAMVLIRLKHADFTVPDLPADPSTADIEAAYAESRAKDYVSALFLATMYAATGGFAAFKARDVANPSLLEMLCAKSQVDRRTPRWADLQAQGDLATSRLGLRLARLDGLSQHYQGHLGEISGVEAVGKEQSRVTQAEILARQNGNAEMTLMTLQPPTPNRTDKASTTNVGAEDESPSKRDSLRTHREEP